MHNKFKKNILSNVLTSFLISFLPISSYAQSSEVDSVFTPPISIDQRNMLNEKANEFRDQGLSFAQEKIIQKWGSLMSFDLADKAEEPTITPGGEVIVRLQYIYQGLSIPTVEARAVRSIEGNWSLIDPIQHPFNVNVDFALSAASANQYALQWLIQKGISPSTEESLSPKKIIYWRFDKPAQTAYQVWTNISDGTTDEVASYQIYIDAATGNVLEGIALNTLLMSEQRAADLLEKQANAVAGTLTTITGKTQYYRSTQGTKENDHYSHTVSIPGEKITVDTSTSYALQNSDRYWQVLSGQGAAVAAGSQEEKLNLLNTSPMVACGSNSWSITPTASETAIWEQRYDWEIDPDTLLMPLNDTVCTWRGYSTGMDAAFAYNTALEFLQKKFARNGLVKRKPGSSARPVPDTIVDMLTIPKSDADKGKTASASAVMIYGTQEGKEFYVPTILIYNSPAPSGLSISEPASYTTVWHETGHLLDSGTSGFINLSSTIKSTKGDISESIGDIWQLIMQHYAHHEYELVYPDGDLSLITIPTSFTGYANYSFLYAYDKINYDKNSIDNWHYGIVRKNSEGIISAGYRNMANPFAQGVGYGIQEWTQTANSEKGHVSAGILNRMVYFLLAGAQPYNSNDPLTSSYLPKGMNGLVPQFGEEQAFEILTNIFYQALITANPTKNTAWTDMYLSTWHYWHIYWEQAATKLYADKPEVLQAVNNAFIGVNVQLDTAPPVVAITAISGDLNAKGGYLPTTLTVDGTVRDEASSVVAMAYQIARPDGSDVCVHQTAALNPSAPVATTAPYTQTLPLSRCADGVYRITVYAGDANKTIGFTTRDITINSQDGTPPVLASLGVNEVGITGILTDDFWVVGANQADPANVDLFYSRPGLGFNNVPLWTIFTPSGRPTDTGAYTYNVTNAEMASGTSNLVNGAYTISGQAVDNAKNVSTMLYAQAPWVIYTDYTDSFELRYSQQEDLSSPAPTYMGKDVYFEAGARHGKLGIKDANVRQLTLWAPLRNRWLYSSVTDSVGYYDDFAFGGVAQLGRNDPWNQYGDELTYLSGYVEDNAGNQTGTGAFYQSYVDTVTPMLIDQSTQVTEGGITTGAISGQVGVEAWITDPITQGVHTAKDHIAASDIELYAVANDASHETYTIPVVGVDLYKPDGLHIKGQLLTSDGSGVIVPNGDYAYHIRAKDQAGNELSTEADTTHLFTVNNDVEPPNITVNTLTSAPERAQLSTNVTFTDDRDLRKTRLTWQGRGYNSGSMINISVVTAPQGGDDLPESYTESQMLTPSVDGRYQVRGEAWDAVSNHGEKTSAQVTVDYYAPLGSMRCSNCILSTSDGQYYAGYAPLTVLAEAIDAGSGVGAMIPWLDGAKLVLRDGITLQETQESGEATCGAAITCKKTDTLTFKNAKDVLSEGWHTFSFQTDDNSPGEGQAFTPVALKLAVDYTAPILAANPVGGCDQATNYNYSCQYTATATDNLALDRLVLSLPGGVSTTHACSLSENFTCKSTLEAVTSANVVNQTGTIYAIDRSGNQATASLKLNTGYSLSATVSQTAQLDAFHTQLTYVISTGNRLRSDVALDSVKITLNGVETNAYANTQQRTFTVTVDTSQFEPGTVVSALEVVASGYRYTTHYDLPVTSKTVRLNESEPNNYPYSNGYNSITVPAVSSGITVDVLYSGGFINKDDPLDTLVLRKFSIENIAQSSISVSDGETTLCVLTLGGLTGGDCSVVQYSLSGGAYQEGYCTPTKDTICDLWVTINNFNSSTLNGKKYVATIHQAAK